MDDQLDIDGTLSGGLSTAGMYTAKAADIVATIGLLRPIDTYARRLAVASINRNLTKAAFKGEKLPYKIEELGLV